MGGVHASMVASLFPGPLALTPLLAPRSAAGAYCSGALYHATAWDELLDELNMKAGDILRAVDLASAANERVAAARRQQTLAALRENTAERDLATQLAAEEAAAAELAGVAAAAAESSSNGSAAGCLSLEQGIGRSIVRSAVPSTDAGNSFVGSVQSWIERLGGMLSASVDHAFVCDWRPTLPCITSKRTSKDFPSSPSVAWSLQARGWVGGGGVWRGNYLRGSSVTTALRWHCSRRCWRHTRTSRASPGGLGRGEGGRAGLCVLDCLGKQPVCRQSLDA
jgi:hypothetical protein